jgi:hypothetical protein
VFYRKIEVPYSASLTAKIMRNRALKIGQARNALETLQQFYDREALTVASPLFAETFALS